MSFPARYDGYCANNCGHRIHPGDLINRDDDGTLWHERCTPKRDPLTLGPREVVCPDCFLVRPCPCVE